MSFSKTVSVVAALASIFGAAAAGWKLTEANSQQPPSALDQRIEQLEKQLVEAKQQSLETAPPAPVKLPLATPQQAPAPAILPPAPTPPPPVPTETQP
jgi:hypothetical protein